MGLTVSRMGIDGLEETEGDPYEDGDGVNVSLEQTVEQWSENCSQPEDQDFEWMGV